MSIEIIELSIELQAEILLVLILPIEHWITLCSTCNTATGQTLRVFPDSLSLYMIIAQIHRYRKNLDRATSGFYLLSFWLVLA